MPYNGPPPGTPECERYDCEQAELTEAWLLALEDGLTLLALLMILAWGTSS